MKFAERVAKLIQDRRGADGCEDCGTLSFSDCTQLGNDIAELALDHATRVITNVILSGETK